MKMIRIYLYFFDPKYSKMDQKNTNCTILIPKYSKMDQKNTILYYF